MKGYRVWVYLNIILLVVCHGDITKAAQNFQSNIGFYITAYGELLPEDDQKVDVAHQVFERVRSAADKNRKFLVPKLTVINNRDENYSVPWAIALPDGHIVLSKHAVEICFQGGSGLHAETRLAFVLGHELAHLANDDFWHQKVYGFLTNYPNSSKSKNFLRQHRALKARELAADGKGLIFAAMAGYPIEQLMDGQFFYDWVQQTNAQVSSTHGSPAERQAQLRERLSDLQDQIAFFEFGVRLSHFGHYDDALYFLREFQQGFPAREALSNIGYTYLQIARQEMDAERAYFYWLPLLLDADTQLPRRGGRSLKSLKQAATGEAEGFLLEAVEYLQQAVKADPTYLPAQLNLVAAHLYLGKPHHARAVLEEARQRSPEHILLRSLESIASYEQSDVNYDLWPTAVRNLQKLARSPSAPAPVLFNLARLLDARQRSGDARRYWNRLAQSVDSLPPALRTIICNRQSSVRSCGQYRSQSAKKPPWPWPLPTTLPTTGSPGAHRPALKGWSRIQFDWFKDQLQGRIYHRESAAVLELAGYPQMQVLRLSTGEPIHNLSTYCDRPLQRRPVTQGMIWTCDRWAALTHNEELREVWWLFK